MKAKLKEMYSLELDCPLEHFLPKNQTNFGFLVRLMIGEDNCSFSESFDVFVCTPDWIKEHYSAEKIIFGRHMLILLEYNLELLKRTLEHYIESCTGENWAAIAQKLARLGSWEFEDYQETSQQQ